MKNIIMKYDFLKYFFNITNFLIEFYQQAYLSTAKRSTKKNTLVLLYPFCRMKEFWIFKTIQYCLSSHRRIGKLFLERC